MTRWRSSGELPPIMPNWVVAVVLTIREAITDVYRFIRRAKR